jgi:pyruvate oxidase
VITISIKGGNSLSKMTVAAYLAEQLDAWGVRYLYEVPGDAILPFLAAVDQHPRLRLISVKNETTAALMASAEAKLNERLGVCLATSGPGAANLLNGLADAKSDRVPVLAITGQVASFNLGTDYKQAIDQNLLMAAVAQYSGLVAVPDSCNDVLVKALRIAVSRGAVTHVAFTKDVWLLPTEEKVRPYEPYLQTVAQSSPEVISEAIRRCNEAERPAILVGRGVQKSGPQLLELAAKWQAGLCLSMPAKGMLSGSDFIMGGLGEGGSEAATALLAAADLILIVGATWWPDKYVPPLKRIIQLDAVPENIGGQTQVEYGLVGDVAVLLPAIINGLSFKEKPVWQEQLRKISRRWREQIQLETLPDPETITPGYLMTVLEKTVAADAIIALDVGDHTVWFNRHFKGSRQEVLISGSWRTMGFGLAAALSAKLSRPEKQVIALCGDGGLAMNIGDFLTAVRYRLPIVVVVVNNGYLGMEKDHMELMNLDPTVTAITNPDFSKIAQACGGSGFRVERPEDLAEALYRAIQSQQPAIVDVITSPAPFPGIVKQQQTYREPAPV